MVWTRLTNAELVAEVRHHLEATVLPAVQGDHARVTAEMLGDILAMLERRLSLEPAWLVEEVETMRGLLGGARAALADDTTPAAVEARAAIERALVGHDPVGGNSATPAAVEERYRETSLALELAQRAFGLAPDPARFDPIVGEVRRYLRVRLDRELVVGGNPPARGRG